MFHPSKAKSLTLGDSLTLLGCLSYENARSHIYELLSLFDELEPTHPPMPIANSQLLLHSTLDTITKVMVSLQSIYQLLEIEVLRINDQTDDPRTIFSMKRSDVYHELLAKLILESREIGKLEDFGRRLLEAMRNLDDTQ